MTDEATLAARIPAGHARIDSVQNPKYSDPDLLIHSYRGVQLPSPHLIPGGTHHGWAGDTSVDSAPVAELDKLVAAHAAEAADRNADADRVRTQPVPAAARADYARYRGDADRAWAAGDERAAFSIRQWGRHVEAQPAAAPVAPTASAKPATPTAGAAPAKPASAGPMPAATAQGVADRLMGDAAASPADRAGAGVLHKLLRMYGASEAPADAAVKHLLADPAHAGSPVGQAILGTLRRVAPGHARKADAPPVAPAAPAPALSPSQSAAPIPGEKKMELSPLQGSEKQVPWAEGIRAKVLATTPPHVREELARVGSAKHWIDNKGNADWQSHLGHARGADKADIAVVPAADVRAAKDRERAAGAAAADRVATDLGFPPAVAEWAKSVAGQFLDRPVREAGVRPGSLVGAMPGPHTWTAEGREGNYLAKLAQMIDNGSGNGPEFDAARKTIAARLGGAS